MGIKTKKMADMTLLICAVIFILTTAVLTWFYKSSLLLVIQMVSMAGLVGGIADWYGVVSIYGRPLKIKWKTEIVVQQREALFRAIKDFVCDDILSKKNIQVKLLEFNLFSRLLKLLAKKTPLGGPVGWLSNFISSMFWEMLKHTKNEEAGKLINGLLISFTNKVNPSKELVRLAEWSIENGYVDKFINSMASGFRKISHNAGLREVLSEVATTAIERYSDDSLLRGVFKGEIVTEVYDGAIKGVDNILRDLEKEPEHEIKIEIRNWVINAIHELKNDEQRQKAVNEWLVSWVESNQISNIITQEMERLRDKPFAKEERLRENISIMIQSFMDKVERDMKLQQNVNGWMLEKLTTIIEKYHGKLGEWVENNLLEMSDQELIQFIRDNTESDLQNIRLNGMFFGLFIGCIVALIRVYVINIGGNF